MRNSLWLRTLLAIVLGGAAGAVLYVVAIFVGIAIGWAFVFGDGNGREDWFLPVLDLNARVISSLCIPLAYWLLVPGTYPHKRRNAILLGLAGLAAALLLLPWGMGRS